MNSLPIIKLIKTWIIWNFSTNIYTNQIRKKPKNRFKIKKLWPKNNKSSN